MYEVKISEGRDQFFVGVVKVQGRETVFEIIKVFYNMEDAVEFKNEKNRI